MSANLPPALRSLALCKVAIWSGDWRKFAMEVRHARSAGFARADYEETLLQAVLFFGFPRVVSAFELLQQEWPTPIEPCGGALPDADQATAGHALFDSIYGRNQAAVHALLRGFHGEFHDFVLEAAYGWILARSGLAPLVRELLAAAALAALQQIPQLVAHSRGALHFGASEAQLAEMLAIGGLGVAQAKQILARITGASSS